MIRKRFARLSAVRWLTGATALFLLFSVSAVNAVTLNFSSQDSGGLIVIKGDGTDASIDFTAAGFNVAQTDFSGSISNSSLTLQGGTITGSLPYQTAEVTGSATVRINDNDSPGGVLTGTVTFTHLQSVWSGAINGLVSTATANLDITSYTGNNADLIELANAPGAQQVISFTFLPPKTLSELVANGADNRTTYAGSISAVPIPAAAWLFGSALFGATLLGRRRSLGRLLPTTRYK